MSALLPFAVLLIIGLAFPLFGGGYWGVIATRACVYWVLVSGLNLVVGFAGQIAIGWVALLTLGAYTTSVLAAGNAMPAWPPYLALAASAVVGAVSGLIVGLPALRLRTFYFAITTLGFATIVTQVALAWQSVTGGGVGVPGPVFPPPFSSQWGFYYFCFGLAAICTWMTANIAASRFGRALAAIRDADVAAEASGISKPAMLVTVFLFSGAVASVAGGLFASLQSYITPDAFTIDLSILFFIAILIGGRSSIIGPLLGTILLTVLPEFAAPLVAWSTFLYAVLLLVIVLVIPGGIAELLDFKNRRPLESDRAIVPRPELVPRLFDAKSRCGRADIASGRAELWRREGDRRARPRNQSGPGARPDRPQRQRQDHHAQRDLRLLCAEAGRGPAQRRHAAASRAAFARAKAHRANFPDPAHRRLGLGAGERHDRRHHRRRGYFRRIAAVAAAALAR